ncbi:MAG: SAM-dependent methyltransferase [Acidimicrobiales bacterium]
MGHWFDDVARFLGPAYLRYSFTKGTDQEVAALVEILDLVPGERVLDVGCGPGRHSLALAAAGFEVVGVDISPDFVTLATEAAAKAGLDDRARFVRADARTLTPEDIGTGTLFEAVISLCQGAFGLAGGPDVELAKGRELDEPILAAMAGMLAPGGRLAVSAFSAYFQLRYLEEADSFDAETGVNHEHTSLRNSDGAEQPAQLWTTCFTPRELRLLARLVGLENERVHGVQPGDYGSRPPSIDEPEFLLVAERPQRKASE